MSMLTDFLLFFTARKKFLQIVPNCMWAFLFLIPFSRVNTGILCISHNWVRLRKAWNAACIVQCLLLLTRWWRCRFSGTRYYVTQTGWWVSSWFTGVKQKFILNLTLISDIKTCVLLNKHDYSLCFYGTLNLSSLQGGKQ